MAVSLRHRKRVANEPTTSSPSFPPGARKETLQAQNRYKLRPGWTYGLDYCSKAVSDCLSRTRRKEQTPATPKRGRTQ